MMSLNKRNIEIVIMDNRKVAECDAGCGIDWSKEETMTLAGQRLAERFGDGVQLKYVNLAGPTVDNQFMQFQQKARDENLALPLLLVNGQPRISGLFDIRMLLDAVETEIEIRP